LNVLLTGYAGFLGRHLARALTAGGFQVRALLHRRSVMRTAFATEAAEARWGSADNAEDLKEALDGVQCVVHSAWRFIPPLAPRPTENEVATKMLLAAGAGAGVESFLFLSSVAVYGMQSKRGAPFKENDTLARGDQRSFVYPDEKICLEEHVLSAAGPGMRIGVLRPGPIFDDDAGPARKILRIGSARLAVGFGTGRNRMAYIHAADVADAAVRWIRDGKNKSVFNVTPSQCLRHHEWYRNWGTSQGLRLKPVFVPPALLYVAAFGVKCLKRLMGKHSQKDVRYAVGCATRDLLYSNESARRELGWQDEATARCYSSCDRCVTPPSSAGRAEA